MNVKLCLLCDGRFVGIASKYPSNDATLLYIHTCTHNHNNIITELDRQVHCRQCCFYNTPVLQFAISLLRYHHQPLGSLHTLRHQRTSFFYWSRCVRSTCIKCLGLLVWMRVSLLPRYPVILSHLRLDIIDNSDSKNVMYRIASIDSRVTNDKVISITVSVRSQRRNLPWVMRIKDASCWS